MTRIISNRCHSFALFILLIALHLASNDGGVQAQDETNNNTTEVKQQQQQNEHQQHKLKPPPYQAAKAIDIDITRVPTKDLNVYGEPLLPCSSKGMALTGFTRRGLCEDYEDPEVDEADYASHNVCIDIPSSRGGIFCTVTGQPNWCDADDYPCTEDKEKNCPVVNWCVCEWAFGRYLNLAGGCDKIADVICDATNIKVLTHYQEGIEVHKDPHSTKALACLKEKCGESILA